MINSPEGRLYPFAYSLQFECTNNTTEYEVLLLGLNNAKDMGIKLHRVEGDAKLIVKQIRDQFQFRKDRLRSYRQRVWNAIGWFDVFNIIYIPHLDNSRGDALAVSTALFMPHFDFCENTFAIELIYRLAVLVNVDNWQVFDDDDDIAKFIIMGDNYKELFFEGSTTPFKESLIEDSEATDSGIIQLKGNLIPKGLVSLENFFDWHDRYIQDQRMSSVNTSAEHYQVNIDTEDKPQLVNLGKCCTPEEAEKFTALFKQYKDVFSWSYEDLKVFKPVELSHTIPLKSDVKPFRQKQRHINL